MRNFMNRFILRSVGTIFWDVNVSLFHISTLVYYDVSCFMRLDLFTCIFLLVLLG